MKRYIITALLISSVLASCSTVSQVSTAGRHESSSVVTDANGGAGEITSDETVTSPSESLAEAEKENSTVPKPTAENSIDYKEYDSFEIDENGAVIEKKDLTELSDKEKIAAAQALYEAACVTEWSYTIGIPYAVNTSEFVTNSFGWKYYLVINDGVNSLADVENDYYKVFSRKYQNALADTFMESNGHVYVLDAGGRGTNMFYTSSDVKSIDSTGEDEITFTVVSHYSGSPYDDSGYYETEDKFTIVREGDSWRVGEFILPY